MSRPFVAVLVGLALLAQTTAMAWASHASPPPAVEPAAAEAMPCHGDDGVTATEPAAPCACCAGGCLFACGGVPLPAPLAPLALAAPDHVFIPAPTLAPLASHARSPFRPPAA